MTLKDLNTNVMIAICSYLLNTCKDILHSHALLKAVYSYIEEVHDALTQSLTGRGETPLEQLTAKASSLDTLHDALNRGLFGVLTSFSEFATDPQRKADLLKLRDTIYPIGLKVNVLSFSAQAGEARRLEEQLKDPQLQSQLKSLKIQDGKAENTVLELATKIAQVGQLLGGTLDQISKLKAEQQTPQAPTPQVPTEGEAKIMFFQLIRMLQENARVALRQHPEKSAILWQKLNDELSRPSPSTKQATPEKAQDNPNTTAPVAENPGNTPTAPT